MPPFVGAIDGGPPFMHCKAWPRDNALSKSAQHQYVSSSLTNQPQFKRRISWKYLKIIKVHPKPSWIEERLEDLRDLTYECIEEAVKKLKQKHRVEDIKAIGLTNQRETTCVWSKSTGKPLHNAIIWPDSRNTTTVKQLAAKSHKGLDALKDITGLPLSTYFAGVKLKWLIDNEPKVKEAHEQNDLQFGTVDTWILWNLTGGKEGGKCLTDVTNASRTMFMNLKTLKWDKECLDYFNVDASCLPTIVSNSQVYGEMHSGILRGVPIGGMIGDQQAALVGQKCLQAGQSKNTYGTGCFLLYHTGDKPVPSNHGLLTTVAYQAGEDGAPAYALEGSIAVAGSSIQWLRDKLNLIESSADIGKFAAEVDDTGGVYFVPAFSGLFAPYWDDSAAGMMIGLSGYTTKQHIARATLEAVCYQTKAILEAMAKDAQSDIINLRVDGGMTNSDLCMQIQADIVGINVERPDMRESTSLGAAICAASAVELFDWDLTKPETLVDVNKDGEDIFKTKWSKELRLQRYEGWNRAVQRAKGWHSEK